MGPCELPARGAGFEPPRIVRVTRVFEANSTAYLMIRSEQRQSFESLAGPRTKSWIASAPPLARRLQMMHAKNFLHRNFAQQHYRSRRYGGRVLLNFGSARGTGFRSSCGGSREPHRLAGTVTGA
jgi:hypothetical protein